MEKQTIRTRWRNNFVYGLLAILPLVTTYLVISFLVDTLSVPVSVLFGHKLPQFFSFVITVFLITFIGFIAKNIFGKSLIHFLDQLIEKIPFVDTIYKSSKHIVQAFSQNKKNLMSVVLVEYPRKDVWALGFITKEDVTGLKTIEGVELGHEKCAVFLPTTPNPTSGYFIYVNKTDIQYLNMSVEESIKVLMSAGVATPEKLGVKPL